MNTDFFSKAIFVQYAMPGGSYKKYPIESGVTYYNGTDNDRYTGMKINSHHYTTKFQYETVLPSLFKLMNLNFDKTLFKKIKNIYVEEGKEYDLSYYVPLNKMNFSVRNIETNIKYKCNYKGLLFNKYSPNCSKYHKLFAFPHSSTHIVNHNPIINKKIVVSGDSQMIPIIPILCYYFRDVWYLDNRSGKNKLSICKDYKEVFKSDFLIIQLYNKTYDFYIKNNFKIK